MVLTAVGVPIMVVLEWDWLIPPLAANAGGAVGDVWMALTLLDYPSHVSVEDRESGIRMLGRATDPPREPSVGTVVWDALAGTAVASVGVVLLVGVAPIVLSVLGVESLAIGTPGTVVHVFAFAAGAGGFSVTVGFGVIVVGAVLGLTYAFGRTYLRGADRR